MQHQARQARIAQPKRLIVTRRKLAPRLAKGKTNNANRGSHFLAREPPSCGGVVAGKSKEQSSRRSDVRETVREPAFVVFFCVLPGGKGAR